MKRFLVLLLGCVLLFSVAAAESGIDLSGFTPEQLEALQRAINESLAVEAEKAAPASALETLNAMIAQGARINPDKLVDLTAETDKNGLLGTVGSYTSKTDFGCTGYADGDEGPTGGTLEYFPERESAKNRFEYVKSIYMQLPEFADSWMYLCGSCVLRVSMAVDADIAIGMGEALCAVTGAEMTDVFDPRGEQTPTTFAAGGTAAAETEASAAEAEAPAEEPEAPAAEETSEATAAETEVPAASGYSELKRGMKGSDVAKLQARLKELGFLTGLADGDFGGQTEAAVRAFQEANGLEQTGVASPQDQALLFASGAIAADGSVAKEYDPYAVCPIELSRVDLHTSYGMNYVTFRASNVSSAVVSAFSCAIRYYDAYGDQLTNYGEAEHVFSNASTVGIGKSLSISTQDDYTFFMQGAATVSVAVTRVRLEDGTDLIYDDPVWFEGN